MIDDYELGGSFLRLFSTMCNACIKTMDYSPWFFQKFATF